VIDTSSPTSTPQRGVPHKPEILAIDLGRAGNADALVSPRVIGRLTDILHGQGNGFCNAAKGQITSDGIVTAAGGLERVPGDLDDHHRSVGTASRARQHLLAYANRICERFLSTRYLNSVERCFPLAQPPGIRFRYISSCLGRFVPLIPLFLGSLTCRLLLLSSRIRPCIVVLDKSSIF
jgi:hypothetical protein